MMITLRKAIMAATIVMAFGASASAQAAYTPAVTTTGNNFTIIGASGSLSGGSNDVTFTWDGTYKDAVVTDGSFNAELSSPTGFAGKKWTVHHMNVYAPGTYVFKTDCVAGDASAGCATTAFTQDNPGGSYVMTVGVGQVGAHMLFNWGTKSDIDIVLLWDLSKSPVWNMLSNNAMVWDGASIDTSMDSNLYWGTSMIDGPFIGQSINFNVNGIHAVPLPAAAWLLGSSLLGLFGVARRKST